MFGMKFSPKKKKQLGDAYPALGEKNGHAYYESTIQSIKDYRAYQNRILFYAAKQDRYPHTNEEYMALLRDLPQFGCGKGVCYAEDPLYLQHLRARLALLKSM